MDSNGDFVLAHVSDLHLGYHSGHKTTDAGVNWREQDGYDLFNRLITGIIKDDTVDAVLVAGDVFHFPDPSNRAIYEAQLGFRRLSKAGIPVYALTGNHDVSDVRAEMASTALLNDPDRKIYSHWEPYAMHEIGPGINLHMVSHHLYKEQAKTWDEVRPVDGAINIFTTHGSMIDPLTKLALHTNQSPREVIIPDELVDNPAWDYRLLGHIHERGFVGSTDGKRDTAGLRTYYNGSLLRRGFSDALTPLKRGWTKWAIKSDGTFKPTFYALSQRPQIDYPVIDAKDKTAADLTDLIMENLTSTFENKKTDKPEYAPILRQTVVNITPEKKRALDNNAIGKLASKALIWSLNLKKDDSATDSRNEIIGQPANGGTLSEQYSKWLEDADVYKTLHDTIREKVATETKEFIRRGQDIVLDEEGQ